jgi:hypothetical protein
MYYGIGDLHMIKFDLFSVWRGCIARYEFLEQIKKIKI